LPILVALFDIVALLGAYFMSVGIMGLNTMLFYTSVNEMTTFGDLAGGLFKAVIFGLCIAAISCRQGLSTEGGALGVGVATMKSVVFSLLAVFILNYFLSALLF
jgi:phospholipid/cholesterol/gamma-HCH transport system permease protein